jgi:hypothetical protein
LRRWKEQLLGSVDFNSVGGNILLFPNCLSLNFVWLLRKMGGGVGIQIWNLSKFSLFFLESEVMTTYSYALR